MTSGESFPGTGDTLERAEANSERLDGFFQTEHLPGQGRSADEGRSYERLDEGALSGNASYEKALRCSRVTKARASTDDRVPLNDHLPNLEKAHPHPAVRRLRPRCHRGAAGQTRDCGRSSAQGVTRTFMKTTSTATARRR